MIFQFAYFTMSVEYTLSPVFCSAPRRKKKRQYLKKILLSFLRLWSEKASL